MGQPGLETRLGERWQDVLAAAGWAAIAGYRLGSFLATPSLLQGGMFVFSLIVTALFVIRRPARAKGSHAFFWLAMAATFLPGAALRPKGGGLALAGPVVQGCGLAFMLFAVAFLNRSFGIAPAHRGLVMRGPYGLVRHPLYAAETIAVAGYCLGYASIGNILVGLATLVAQLLRIQAEEHLLSRDAEYRAYKARVPWRLVPAVW